MEKILVVMAAGLGSRFGGLKQIEPVGPNGEFIIDYSIYDAIRAGFTKVIFIIKEENFKIFKDTIGKRIEKHIKVDYAFQKLEDIPKEYDLTGRKKPLGTAHALYAARNLIKGNFAVINADDFYGFHSLKTVADFLDNNLVSSKEHYALVGYKVKNTITLNGSVKRGVCNIKDNKLISLDESKIEIVNGKIEKESLNTHKKEYIKENTLVSMNLLGFPKEFIKHIEDNLLPFLEKNSKNLEEVEYLIPDVVTKQIEENKAEVKVLETTDKWYGITYKDDKDIVVKAISNMIKDGIYPNNLWN